LSKHAGFSFISLSSADLKVGYIGQAAVAIQKHFGEARKKAPCIVYIDEIDASCPTRQSGHGSVIDNEVNAQLLQELDGMKTSNDRPIFVFASTNRKDLIDPAILQRFTEHIEIALPSVHERFHLLRLFIGTIPFEIQRWEKTCEMEAELEAQSYRLHEHDNMYSDDPWFILTYKGQPFVDLGCHSDGKCEQIPIASQSIRSARSSRRCRMES
jgi:AAA+ superfamily predicted ATPase